MQLELFPDLSIPERDLILRASLHDLNKINSIIDHLQEDKRERSRKVLSLATNTRWLNALNSRRSPIKGNSDKAHFVFIHLMQGKTELLEGYRDLLQEEPITWKEYGPFLSYKHQTPYFPWMRILLGEEIEIPAELLF